jgi:HK97 family phage major capsid protein
MLRAQKFKLFAFVALIAVFGIAHAFGVQIDPDYIAAISVGALVGDTQVITDIKTVLENYGRAFEEFKKTNDELIKAKADGKAIGDIEAKLAKITTDMDQLAEIKTQFDEVVKKINRPNFGEKDAGDLELETKSFNSYRKGLHNSPVADISAEQYTEYKKAFWTFIRKGSVELLSDAERKAMSAGTDPDGGYLLPTPTVGAMAKRIYELSNIRQIANVMSISTDALEGINDLDEAACGWVGETSARPDTGTPQVGKYRIEAHEMYAQPKATQKLLDDSLVDVEAWLAGKVADKMARTEGAAFITGDGVSKPRGFTTYTTAATADSARAWGTMEHIKTGVNGDFAASNPADILFDLLQAFKPAYLDSDATWVTRREVLAKIRKFKITGSGTTDYLWQPGLQAGVPDRLLGFPITMAQDMPTLGTGSLSLALGDFKDGYQIVDRMGARVLRDPFTDKPYVKFYTTRRVGGAVVNFEAIKFVNFSA